MAAKRKSQQQTSKTELIRLLVLTALILLILYYSKGLFIAALVNGDPISRLDVVYELEKEQGKEALDWLITKKLILQEARKRKVMVTSKEVDEEVRKLERSMVTQGQSVEQALALQGISKESFRTRIKIAKILEKIFTKEVVVTEKEIDEFIEQNRESFPETVDLTKLRPTVRQQLYAQKIDQKGNELIQKLKKDAKILRFVNY